MAEEVFRVLHDAYAAVRNVSVDTVFRRISSLEEEQEGDIFPILEGNVQTFYEGNVEVQIKRNIKVLENNVEVYS